MRPRPLLILIVLTGLTCHTTFSQAQQQQQQKQLFFNDPRTASFTIFGDIPVSHTTGVPDISIPLFTLESHGYKVPITLKYHLALVKPPYQYTNVATGWVLEVGGTITHEFKSQNDLKGMQPAVFLDSLDAYTINQNERDFLTYVNNKYYDTEHDIFSYTLPTGSGKFIVDKNAVTQGKHDVKCLTDAKLKGSINTTYWPNIPDYAFQNIELIDDKGQKYLFLDHEGGTKSRAYFLNQIKTPNDVTLFDYEYADFSVTTASYVIQNLTVTDEKHYLFSTTTHQDDPTFPLSGAVEYNVAPTYIELDKPGKTAKKITFENGTLEFTLSANNKFIEGMVLKDKDGKTLKTVTFEIQFFPGQGYRYLNKLYIKGSTPDNVEVYSFAYNASTQPVNNNDLSVDYWGYLSNYTGNVYNQIPMYAFTFAGTATQPTSGGTLYNIGIYNPQTQYFPFGAGNRDANYFNTSVYTLNSITYPTGGRTEFAYELNNTGGGAAGNVGGLRIERITNYSDSNTISGQKRYEYAPGEIDFPLSGDYTTQHYNYDVLVTVNHNIQGRRTRYFSYNKTPPVSDNRARYRQVTEYWQNGTDDIGKTVYDYEYYHINMNEPYDNNYFLRLIQDHISNGLLKKTTVYKKDGSSYVKILEEVMDYTTSEMWRSRNLFLNRQNFYSLNGGDLQLAWYERETYWELPGPGFIPFYYDILAGTYKLTHKTTTQYTDAGNIVMVNDYEYSDGLDKYITGESSTASDGATMTTNFKYPYAAEFASLSPYNTMITKNIISEPVQITRSVTRSAVNTLLSTTKFNFSQFGTNIFRPETVQGSYGSAPLETRYRYGYETILGNLISTKKDEGLQTTYLWDYNNSHAVAQAIGAENSQIAYTSFEADGKGNWTFAGTPATDATAPTGKKCYNLGSGTMNRAGLNSGTTYIISYWYKTGASPSVINGTHSNIITGPTRGDWTYTERRVTGTTSITLGGSGFVDEVRLYPVNATMTTYTYDVLVGTTSHCDANNRISYYEYDNYSRLILVRDFDRKILKKFCYNFAGQTENCAITYYNDINYSGTYYSQYCGPGQTPDPIYVSVPPGSHSSPVSVAEANTAAQQYAQDYADMYGGCSSADVDLYFDNNAWGAASYVQFTNTSTWETHYFELPFSGYGYLGTIPAGTYNVEAGNYNFSWLIYQVGCSSGQSGNQVYFYGVQIDNSCYIVSVF